jgi:hypothetical protein
MARKGTQRDCVVVDQITGQLVKMLLKSYEFWPAGFII